MRIRTIIATFFPIATALAVGATSFTSPTIYSSPWWYLLWGAIGLCVAVSLLSRKIRQHKSLAGLHFSLLLIIAGGGITALTSERGTMRLKAGLSTDSFFAKDGTEYRLPTTLTMLSLDMEYYPGMTFPRDFKTMLSTASGDTVEISLNHIGHIHPYKRPWDDYRIYQTSYSDDGSSILTVVRDPSGIALTYSGYILFIVCGIWHIISSSGLSFSRLSRKSATIFMILTATCGMSATECDASVISEDSLINCQVLFRGHAMPFETMASKVSLTLTGAEHVAGMDASSFLASLITAPSKWENVPLLRIKDNALRKALGIDGQYVSLSALYSDDGVYYPQNLWKEGNGQLDDAILRLDEKVALLAELQSGELFTIIPPESPYRLSPIQTLLMVQYDRCRPLLWFAILSFSAVALAMIFQLSARKKRIRSLSNSVFTLTAIFGAVAFSWNWAASPSTPMVSSPDIMFFTAVIVAIISSIISRSDFLSGSCGIAACGALATVAWLGSRSPQLTPLMPVLATPWLSVHVSLLMAAYALLGLSSIISLAALIRKEHDTKATNRLLRGMTGCGVYLLGAGIWIGAMWANVSWGRYWSWDPKETWALVTMMLYAIPLHKTTIFYKKERLFYIYIAAASLSIAMTYAGVNYLPSLHAYR